MSDINTFDSAQLGEYLLNSGIVPVGKEKFMVIWARKFFASRSNWPDFPWHEQITLFLKQLDESGNESWQLRQADQAVRLYFNNFLGKSNINVNHAHSSLLDTPVMRHTFQQALLKFTENLRLKNYARS